MAPCAQSASPPLAAAICIAVVSVSGGVIILSEQTVVVVEGIGPESTSASKPLVVQFQLLVFAPAQAAHTRQVVVRGEPIIHNGHIYLRNSFENNWYVNNLCIRRFIYRTVMCIK